MGHRQAEPSSRPESATGAAVPSQTGHWSLPQQEARPRRSPATPVDPRRRPYRSVRHRGALPRPHSPAGPPPEPDSLDPDAIGAGPLSRRGFLRVAGVAGLTGVAATVAACTAAAAPQWSFGPRRDAAAAATARSRARRRPSRRPRPRPRRRPRRRPHPRATPGASLPARLDRARHRRAQRHPPLRRQPRAGPRRASSATRRSRSSRTCSAVGRGLPGAGGSRPRSPRSRSSS